MSDPAELAHRVLARVAELLRSLSRDQLEAFADGSMRLKPVESAEQLPSALAPPSLSAGGPATSAGPPTPAQPASRPPTPAPPAQLPRPVEDIGAQLVALGERAAATAYLDGLNLSATQLRSLARALGIAVSSKATRAQARDTVVHWTVGRRADSAILSRPQ